ncbi:MAG: class B sortase [Lachnospiraceae bacterium]
MKKKRLLNVIMVICLLTALGCGGYLLYYYFVSNQNEGQFDILRTLIETDKEEDKGDENQNIEYVDIDGVKVQKKFENLYRQNKDFMGWVTIEDTNVDYPVMYTPNDTENGEYYIHRDFNKEYSSAGTPFIDSNCSIEPATDNVIIYGHNMNSGKMFHDIIKYEDKEFYETHKTFEFDTIYGDGTYEVVAIIRAHILPEDSTEFKYYEFVNAGTETEFMEYIDNIKAMSVIDTKTDVKYGDKLITLSTCAYHVKDGRFAVIAKKIN